MTEIEEEVGNDETKNGSVSTDPFEVIIKKEETQPEPDFDYDSILLDDDKILGIEKEIQEIQDKKQIK